MIIFCDYRRLLGKGLAGLGIKELQHLEQQINEGLSSVKERKVLILTVFYFFVFLPPPHQRCQISAMGCHGDIIFDYRNRQFVKDGGPMVDSRLSEMVCHLQSITLHLTKIKSCYKVVLWFLLIKTY